MKKLFLLLFLMTISLGQSQNLITNSYFNGNSSTGWTANGIPAAQTASAVGNEFVWSATNSAAPEFSSEFYQAGISMTSGATYTVTFRARATSARNIKVQMQNVGGWGVVYANVVGITTTMTVYSYTFVAAITSADTQMQFHLGGTGSTAGVTLDDITLVAGTATQCTNFIQDVDETGIDCGGGLCSPCLLNPNLSIAPASVSKFVGDANFTQTATSDSPVAITYASGTPGTATVNATTGEVTIVSAGTTIITATQVANASYNGATASYTLTATFSPPATGAPAQPGRNAWDVVSLYSGDYTATPGATWQNGAQVSLSGNNAQFFNGFTLARLAFAPVNLATAGMTHLHLSVYTHNQNQLWFEVNGHRRVESSIALNGWVEFNIPIGLFVGLVPGNNISFFDLNNPTGAGNPQKVVYMDDVYFYRAPTSPAPSFDPFTIAAKIIGDAPFTVTATSNSGGAITYSSATPGVATIHPTTGLITIVGGGSTIITASQAADAPYAAGSVTATLNVTAAAPTVAAPTPPARNAWDVLSVYSAAYTPVAGTRNYNPNWGQSGFANFAQPTPGGDEVLNYKGVNYQGISIGSAVNATDMTHVHIDIWSINNLSTDFRLITAPEISEIVSTPLGQWNSFDIPLSDFAGINKANIFELKFQPFPFGGTGEWFIDNIYFYRAATLLPPTFSTTFAVPAKFTNSAPFTLTPPTSNSAGAFSYSSSNPAVATVLGNTVTIVGSGTTVITATQAADGIYGLLSATANLAVTFPVPTVAAPTPTVPAINVVSLFSNAYTDQAGTNFNPNWGQSTSVADVTIAGNTTKRYSTLNYQGTQFTTIDAVALSLQTIHFDFLSPNATAVRVSLISNTGGGEKAVVVPTTPLNSWKSVDLLLTQFSSQGLNLTGLFQIKIENWTGGGPGASTGGELYIDNIYFSDVVTNVAPIISMTIPTKLLGDPGFNVTATSSSAGAITYTSSNAAVATVTSGGAVTIVGAGTTVITANQVANGSYTSGSIAANLVVSGNPTISAGNPTRIPAQVKSVYSNPYLNAATSYDNYGGPATRSDISISRNTTLKISSMGRMGINLTGGLDVSNMKTLHIDIFTPNVTKFNLILINLGVQTLFPLNTAVNGWNRFDLSITGVSRVEQILLVASPDQINTIASTTTTGAAYIDNVYFWTDVTNLTQLRPGFCGKTLSYLSQTIQASPVSQATEYTFEVTRVDNSFVTEVVSPNFYFDPTTEIVGGLVYGKSYSVKVKAKVAGIYSVYGNACIVSAPAEPIATTTQIRPFQCGATLSSIVSMVQASPVYQATNYEFEVTSDAGTFIAPSNNYYFSLYYSVPGNALYSTAYSIRVRSKGAATEFTDWGPACVVTTPASPAARMSDVSNEDVFNVKAFPNPFASNFNLDIESSSDNQVEMKVYDMIGRQLEARKASVSELSVIELGSNYPSGIYNVVVSQGKNVKSIRMIKR